VEETKDPNYQTELNKARGGKLMLKLEHGGSVVSEQEIIGSFPGVEEMLDGQDGSQHRCRHGRPACM